jgi:hypothetical protein
LYKFVHNLLDVRVQIENKFGSQKIFIIIHFSLAVLMQAAAGVSLNYDYLLFITGARCSEDGWGAIP